MSTSTEFGTEFLSLRANSCCVEPNRRTADAATRLQEDYFVLECMGVAIRLAASTTPEKCSASKAGRVVAASGRMTKKTETTLISTTTSTAGRSVSRVANTWSSNKKETGAENRRWAVGPRSWPPPAASTRSSRSPDRSNAVYTCSRALLWESAQATRVEHRFVLSRLTAM